MADTSVYAGAARVIRAGNFQRRRAGGVTGGAPSLIRPIAPIPGGKQSFPHRLHLAGVRHLILSPGAPMIYAAPDLLTAFLWRIVAESYRLQLSAIKPKQITHRKLKR